MSLTTPQGHCAKLVATEKLHLLLMMLFVHQVLSLNVPSALPSPVPVVESSGACFGPRLWPPPTSPIFMFILQSSALLLCNYSSLVAERNIFLP